jgi:hypothetical protein
MPRCALCNYGGKKRGFIEYKYHPICDVCWDSHDGDVGEALMAKKKIEIRPCKWCKTVDPEWKTDQARRAHQGRCPKNPSRPPPLKKPKKKKKKKKRKATKKKQPRPPKVKDPKHVAAGKKSKRKGGRFENEVKKQLAAWYGEDPKVTGTKESKFQRTPGSGGQSEDWPLDLIVPADFPWAVECKNREGDGGLEAMERHLTSNYPVVKWFREAEEELVNVGVNIAPLLLVITRNRFPTFAVLRRPSKNGTHYMFPCNHITLCGKPWGELVVLKLDDLLCENLGTWTHIYQYSDPNTFMPRRWE